MEQENLEIEVASVNESRFSIPRYLCQKINMFGRGQIYASSKRKGGLLSANTKVRGAECVLLENSQDGLLSLPPLKIRTDNILSPNMKAWLLPPVRKLAACEVQDLLMLISIDDLRSEVIRNLLQLNMKLQDRDTYTSLGDNQQFRHSEERQQELSTLEMSFYTPIFVETTSDVFTEASLLDADFIYRHSQEAVNLRAVYALQAAERDETAEDHWAPAVGFKVDSLGFPETFFQKNRVRQMSPGRSRKERQTRPPRAPSWKSPDELAKQVEVYAIRVTELRELLKCVQISLLQEEERRKNAEEQAVHMRDTLSRELVEAQKNRAELRAKLELEQQERAKFGARLSFLSETVALRYGPADDAEERDSEEVAISGLLKPHELQLVSQLREAKRLRSLAETRIESLKAQVKQLESMCDSVKTYQKVCHRRETAWRYGLLTLVQAMLICFGVAVVFGREPIVFGNLIPS